DAFVGGAAAGGARFLLVITGKGGRGGGRGLLREAVPGWLRAGPHGPRILGIFEAHRRHGGAGALYVYLRKPG
ncbi:MAG TPA: Smr/MutS family protein, partial [Thermohalobaculum sp.]|nr:Smr/MutS family protein [Thermohalobaculum sp.]